MRVADIKETDEVTTIEGLADTVDGDLHPMQEAWLEYDVAQCGYCQPGQIMAAVATVRKARAEGHEVTDADLDEIRNVCRCGTYSRIREAIKAGAQRHVSRGRVTTRAPGGPWSDPPPTHSATPADGGRLARRRHVHSAPWPAQTSPGLAVAETAA